MINTKLQSIIDTKSAIGNAIVNKGGTITGETPFFNYAAQIDGISTGTPQTIFAASDGSKWALTNAVNLTNVSNNVTSDFNYWQPANNSTSDPILNVGTVGANISGNIRIVQVNQVNIAQYSNIVINDTTGAKYVGYNGYDANTNPTPTGNVVFNRWVLNNSATGTVIFANATIVNGGTFNGPNTSVNQSSMPFLNNSVNYGGTINDIKTNNAFVYAVGDQLSGTNETLKKYHESNLAFVGNSVSYGGTIQTIAINNGFIYIGGATNRTVWRIGESNLTRTHDSANYGGTIRSIAINNGFVYAVGQGNETIQKFHESNLVRTSNSAAYVGQVNTITINNGFIYIGGSTNRTVKKFHESNLAFVGNTSVYSDFGITSLTTSNGFIYAGGSGPNDSDGRDVKKYYESNLVYVGNTPSYGGVISKVKANNGFIFVSGEDSNRTYVNGSVAKYYESNLAFINKTANFGITFSLHMNNGIIYSGFGNGAIGNGSIHKFEELGVTLDNQTFYTATKIKE